MANYLTETGLVKVITKVKGLHASHANNTSNPHKVTKTQLALENVENKSSEMIRAELTTENVVTALGFEPLENIEVDSVLSTESTNPVENKIVTEELNNKVPLSRTVNGKTLDKDIILDPEDVGADVAGTAEEFYNDLNEKVELMDIQTSTSNTLYGTKDGGLRLIGMGGGTEQKTLTGKNKLDHFNTTGTFISAELIVSANELYRLSEVYPIGQYIVSWSDTSTADAYVYLIYYDENKNIIKRVAILATTKTSQTIDETAGAYFAVSYAYGVSGTKFVYDVQIEEGDTATDYEEYCGNTPSPNPDYPQSINNTGDCVEMIQGYYQYVDGKYVNTNGYICCENPIPCKSGDVVKLLVDTDKVAEGGIVWLKDGVRYAEKYIQSTWQATAPSGATSFVFNLSDANLSLTPSTVGKIQLTVNGKYVTQIVERGKNLLNFPDKTISNLGITVEVKDGVFTVSGTSSGVFASSDIGYLVNIPIKAGTYYLSGSANKVNVYASIAKNGTTRYYSEQSIVIDGTETSFKVYIQVEKGITVNTTLYPQLEPGTTATDFEPYREHIATIYTDEPLRSSDVVFKGDDRLWKVERNACEEVFDGTKTIHIANANQYYINLDTNAYSNNFQPCYCSHFIGSPKGAYYVEGDNLISVSSTKIWIYSTSFTTNTDLNTYFIEQYENGTPVKIQYELATPTYEILDNASQLALNALETFNDVTYIEIDSRVQPESVEWEYGTSQVTARMIKNELRHDTQDILIETQNARIEELATALVALNQESSIVTENEPNDETETESENTENLEETTE